MHEVTSCDEMQVIPRKGLPVRDLLVLAYNNPVLLPTSIKSNEETFAVQI